MSSQTAVSIVIPFYNEKDNLPVLLEKLEGFASKNPAYDFEVIFVDDGSTDDSHEIVRNHSPMAFRMKLVRLSRNFGSHAALRAGTRVASCGIITFTYADMQDPLELILRLHEKMTEGYEAVWGIRRSTQEHWFRRFYSFVFARVVRVFMFSDFLSTNTDMVMFGEKVRNELNEQIEGNTSLFLQIFNLGFRQGRISYDRQARFSGKSKWTFLSKIKVVIDTFVGFSYAPIRLVSVVGFTMAFLGFCYALYVIYRKLVYNDINPGWPSIVSLLMIGFGITNISIGIIAEYLWRTLDVARNRKVFIIENIEDKSR